MSFPFQSADVETRQDVRLGAVLPEHCTLVLGYGSTLRGDDGAGPRVAELVQTMGLAGTRVLTCHQLTPELAQLVSEAEQIVFVDAAEDQKEPCRIGEVLPSGAEVHQLGHFMDPGSLLLLARRLYHAQPRAWLVTVAARDFSLGEELTPECREGAEAASRAVRRICEDFNR